ncbi:hypothetical protein ACJ73_09525 [Blastomyces percursus]|uniref:Uncharacterized protein n=1 Tax=Blastomyces percursus TaxID=1658174 RepID=A0A1J9Q8J5_9EURO|nr:hypothetical protein ACJ73_09525 [Blastomyces percursus]
MANLLFEKREDGNSTPTGPNWVTNFFHPEIKSKFVRKFNYKRSLCEDPKIVQNWFQLVQNITSEYQILSYGACVRHLGKACTSTGHFSLLTVKNKSFFTPLLKKLVTFHAFLNGQSRCNSCHEMHGPGGQSNPQGLPTVPRPFGPPPYRIIYANWSSRLRRSRNISSAVHRAHLVPPIGPWPLSQLVKGCQMTMHRIALLEQEVKELRAANAKQKRKRETGRTYVAQEGALGVGEGLNRVQRVKEWEQGVVETADSTTKTGSTTM